MKKYIYILIGIGLAIAGTAFALPTNQSTQTLLPFVDNTYSIGTISPTNLRYNAYLYNAQIDNDLCLGGVCNSAWPASASTTLLSDNNRWTGLNRYANRGTTTFSGGIESPLFGAPYFVATSTTATSTFFGGILGKTLTESPYFYASTYNATSTFNSNIKQADTQIIISGAVNPDINGEYYKAGTFGGRDYYQLVGGTEKIWFRASNLQWIVGDTLGGVATPLWYIVNGGKYPPTSGYTNYAGSSGTIALVINMPTFTNYGGAFFGLSTSTSIGIATTSPKATIGMEGGIGVNSTQLCVNSSGAVGVGTCNPSHKFGVYGNTGSPSDLVVWHNSAVAGTQIVIGDPPNGNYPGIWIGQTSPSYGNYAFLNKAGATLFNAQQYQFMEFNINNDRRILLDDARAYFTPLENPIAVYSSTTTINWLGGLVAGEPSRTNGYGVNMDYYQDTDVPESNLSYKGFIQSWLNRAPAPLLIQPVGGNIGIASTSPGAKLSLAGNSLGTTPMMLVSTSTASATSTAVIIDKDGKFGIGTSTPVTQFSVTGGMANTGDTYWMNDSSGVPYGSFYGNEIAYSTGALTAPEYKQIADTDCDQGEVNEVTYTDAGTTLTVSKAGRYLINWAIAAETGTANTHMLAGITVNSTTALQTAGRNHFEPQSAGKQYSISGTAILDLAANDVVGVGVGSDVDNITITVDHVNLTVTMVGGT